RPGLLNEPYPYLDKGKTLLWLEPWDGSDSIPLSSLDPFFTEVCRRVRLVKQGETVLALGAPSSAARLASNELLGNVGDPWTPITIKTNGALTLSENGFTPIILRDLIFKENYHPAPMQLPKPEDRSGWFCASVLVRGQGTTDGFHEAAIRVPEKARPLLLGQGRERDRLAELSKTGLDTAAAVQNKVLRPALYALMEGGPEQIDFGKREVSDMVTSMAAPFTQGWRPRYFDWLWTTLDQPDDVQAVKPWFQDLRRLAEKTLEQAVRNSPLRRGRGYRSVVRANEVFYGGLKKQFPQFLEERNESK
ncbi:MAG: type I-E CRISPR-associated protein Cse1/CasA, partial [Thermodesulfobacteriota bacterium]|nr:type I-E CRISPR-associated protein Cse1/CasA [Thermodesulfobacteriota bacterium]